MGQDILYGEVQNDGTLKITTGEISPANHQSAENVLKGITKITGGASSRTPIKAQDRKLVSHVHEAHKEHA